uniref:Uncharacterized protein n=1 Tax=Alexandrium monilatum TaxID=311494 RepID=A0A7S4PXX0_9DINO
MMARAALLAALALSLRGAEAASSRTASGSTPVQKVVQLLESMSAKGKREKKDEEVQFAAYKRFCDDTAAEKGRGIAKAEDEIITLKASVEKYTADAKRLTKEIAAHDSDADTMSGDIKAAMKVRGLEKADYETTHKDYSETIGAIQRAIDTLRKQAYSRPQAKGALLQLAGVGKSRFVPMEAKRAIEALLQQTEGGLAAAAPEASGYEFQSQAVITMLETLLEKFSAERTTLEKEEATAQHAFELLIQDLKAQVSEAKQDSSDKTAMKAKKLQAKADAEGDLVDTTSTRDADKTYLSDLVATCEMKATDFVARQDLRAQELKALGQAIEIIAGSDVSGTAERYLPSLLEDGTSLAALRSEQRGRAKAEALRFLRLRGQALGSRVLSAAAERLAADPFKKVKKLIKDLLVRLMEEANEEVSHKGWCDTELAANTQTRRERTEAVESLHAQVDQLEASIAKFSEELADLTKAVAELEVAMAEATKLRQEEEAKNKKTIADAREAQTAVAQALIVLKEFYAKAGQATALVQQQQLQAPPIFDSPYQGMQAASGGVVGMLEVIESDFARLEANTESAEASAKKQYETFMGDTSADQAKKQRDIEHKTSKKQDQSQALTVAKRDLEGTQKELDAALDYFDKLKPSCVDVGVSYEDRVRRREGEVQSLQQALRILNGEDDQ